MYAHITNETRGGYKYIGKKFNQEVLYMSEKDKKILYNKLCKKPARINTTDLRFNSYLINLPIKTLLYLLIGMCYIPRKYKIIIITIILADNIGPSQFLTLMYVIANTLRRVCITQIIYSLVLKNKRLSE